MRVYFDTEFTGLNDDAGLISVGFVTADGGASFYAELTDTFSENQCSEFCRASVLPLLQGGDCRMTLSQLQERLATWLVERGSEVVLICDSARDVVQLKAMFPLGLPANCSVVVLSSLCNLWRRLVNFRRRVHVQLGIPAHHALNDAEVNRRIFSNSWICKGGKHETE
jgi:hypothetical protein